MRDIPVFDWIIKVYGGINTVRDRIFTQKIGRFLQGAQTASLEKRKMFVEMMRSHPAYQQKVGESLFLLIDRHETLEKSKLLGKVFAAWIEGEITYEEYERYAFIIDRLFIHNLINLKKYYGKIEEFEASREKGEQESQKRFLDEIILQALFGDGLLDSTGYTETTYLRNTLGEKLIRLIGPEESGQ